MDRLTIAEALRSIASYLELDGAPRFRVDAYVRGARAVEATKNLDTLAAQRRLTELPGIGHGLARVIDELLVTGRSTLLEQLEAAMPPGAKELAPVATRKQIERLHAALGVTTIAELEAACRAGRVREVSGFGVATEAKLLAKIERFHVVPPALRLRAARVAADKILDYVRGQSDIAHIEVVGAVLRGEETLDHIELLALGDEHALALARMAFERQPAAIEVSHAAAAVSARYVDGTRATLHLAPLDDAGRARVRAIGPASHVADVEACLPKSTDLSYPDEAAVYAAIGSAVPPPELRDVPGILGAAPVVLVEAHELRGAIHCHTTFSDGKDSVLAMARAAEARGLDYITITDHSPTASYAGGCDIDKLMRQWEAIDEAQAETRVRILRGTESDILADGALDYPDHILERLDIIIASIHNRYQQDEDAMTRRLVRAMRHPLQKVWGHPFGRLLLRRPPVPCRFDEVVEAIVESDAIIELNGDPWRMDMGSAPARHAHALGVRRFVVSVDAHAVDELRNVQTGITLARRAGLSRAEVLNTRDVDGFLAAVRPTRG